LYYGMLLFSRGTAHDGKLLPVQVTSTARVRTWATLGSDGAVRVSLLNEDPTMGGEVTVNLSQPRRAGQLFRLSAPSLTAATGIHFAGMTFDGTTDGKPTSAPQGEAVAKGATGGYTFLLPATSVAGLL